MRLKKLELIGFKSFAEKTVLEFDGDITAFVGPNGAGKSNVVDALKWVLGEQSAKRLRGGEMADMIFSGSASRKALGCAEVRVTLLNDRGMLPVEYEEVCICRRCYRSGESEYSLNGQSRRLKDIRALLLDTGVGVSAYSFIEQGQVDRLIQADSKERRRVLEEAAGINRYLAQKKEAEGKLEHVRDNLQRVSDIVQELERELRSVRYQAAKARRFKRQSDELRRMRLALALHTKRGLLIESAGNVEAIEKQDRTRRGLEGRMKDLRTGLAAGQEELEGLRAEMSRVEERLAQIDARHYGLGREIELSDKRRAELQSQRTEMDRRRSDVQTRVNDVRREIQEANSALEQGSAAVEEHREACRQQAEALQSAEQEGAELAARLDSEKAGVFELLQEESRLHNQTTMLRAERDTLASRLKRQQGRREQVGQHRERIRSEKTEADRQLGEVSSELTRVREDLGGVENRLSEASMRMESLTAEIGDLRAELKAKMDRCQLLEDLQARAEGVGSGVKLILGEIGRAGSVLAGSPGLLANLVNVSRRDALAVEAALGQRSQTIVVKERRQAVEALRMLRKGRRGRADVLPLEGLAGRGRLELCGGDTPADRLSELVQAVPGCEAVVEALFGNCFVVEDLDAARRLLSEDVPAGVRIVTRQGECFEPGGVWSAGEPQAGSLISRRSELAELSSEIRTLESEFDALSGEGKRCADRIADVQRERALLSASREELAERESRLRGHLSLLDTQEAQRSEELDLIESEVGALAEEMVQNEARSAEAASGLEEGHAARAEREALVERLQQQAGEQRELQERLLARVSELRSERARLEEQQNGLTALAQRLRAELSGREEELKDVTDQQQESERLQREAEERMQTAAAERAQLEVEKARLNEIVAAKTAERDRLRQTIEAREAELEQVDHDKETCDQALQKLRLVENELRLKLDNLVERGRDECGVHLGALELEPGAWRQEPLFTETQIQEFAGDTEQDSGEVVAQWYAQESKEAEETPEEAAVAVVPLAEAQALRESVLAIADDAGMDWPALREQADKLKKQVERMGGANLDAIREQDELEIRAQFLTNQRDDLDRARRQELEIIRKLSAKSRESFVKTFEDVRANFQTMLRKLFGGGSGDMTLEAGAEDVLEAGIEITVRPPGKETRSLSLLSGGERALSAVALLFAIFKSKPSPFCLLDEVDAPLDEANIGRFVAMLDEYCESTQFVIVTHSKVTMAAAQTLYGISLREDGASQKVAVNFEEVDVHLREMSRQTRRSTARAKAG